MLRLLLVRHGATAATRANAFGGEEPLEAKAVDEARALSGSLPERAAVAIGPEPACAETASYLGLGADPVRDPHLAACDVGRWRGQTLDDVLLSDPSGAMAWLTDPSSAPHGGESVNGFIARVQAWMGDVATLNGFLVAVVDAGVVKAAVVAALGAPAAAFWRVDIAPLCVTELHARDGRWTLTRSNAAIARRDGVSYGAA